MTYTGNVGEKWDDGGGHRWKYKVVDVDLI